MNTLSAIFHLAAKDIRIELRTREALASMVIFSLLVIVLFHFGFAELGANAVVFAPGALWVTFTFSAMIGLSRSFSMEEMNGCLRGLLLCPHDRGVIYAGKTAAAVVTVTAASSVTLVLFTILFNLPVSGNILLIWVVMFLGIAGIAAVGTLFSAMSQGTRMRQTLLPVLVLPVILPQVVFGMNTTAKLLGTGDLGSIPANLVGMLAFDVILATVGVLTFEHVVVE